MSLAACGREIHCRALLQPTLRFLPEGPVGSERERHPQRQFVRLLLFVSLGGDVSSCGPEHDRHWRDVWQAAHRRERRRRAVTRHAPDLRFAAGGDLRSDEQAFVCPCGDELRIHSCGVDIPAEACGPRALECCTPAWPVCCLPRY